MSSFLGLALLLAFALPMRADEAIPLPERQPGANVTNDVPDSMLVRLENSLLAKQKERDDGVVTQKEYQEWLTHTEFRSALDTATDSLPANPANKALHARILARLGQSEAREAKTDLRAALSGDPGNPSLLLALSFVQSQQGEYSGAAASAQAVLDSKHVPPPSPELMSEARSLWFSNKDRAKGSAGSRIGAPSPDRAIPARDSPTPDRWHEIQAQAEITQLHRQAKGHGNEAERAAQIGDWQLALKKVRQAEALLPGDPALRDFREALAEHRRNDLGLGDGARSRSSNFRAGCA